jgi:hypothetical protein
VYAMDSAVSAPLTEKISVQGDARCAMIGGVQPQGDAGASGNREVRRRLTSVAARVPIELSALELEFVSVKLLVPSPSAKTSKFGVRHGDHGRSRERHSHEGDQGEQRKQFQVIMLSNMEGQDLAMPMPW